ncbi:methyltransferase [Nocardiopsis tropica]
MSESHPAPMHLSPALAPLCQRLGPALASAGFTESGVRDLLGDDVFGCLSRGEPGPVLAAAAGPAPLAVLTRLFLAAAPVPGAQVDGALHPVTADEAVAAGLLEADPDDPSAVRAALGLRPLDLPDGATQWFVSDLDGLMRPHPQHREHVLGVGHASQSLLRATPRAAVGTVLDLGTGCGVHACAAARFADHVVATDISERAAGFAAASAALNGVEVDVRAGSWFEPVAGQRFDLLVANPPFVVGEGRVDHTYRDSGLDLDGASELVVRGAPEHLAPGGTAALLASWVHREGESWQARVASWLPSEGVAAWVLQRDVADPALYVGTWLRDEGLDPRVGEGRAKSDRWLAHLADAAVTGIGFGFVYLRAIDGPSEVVCEELSQPFDDPLGAEVPGHFARMAWLHDADLGAARPRLMPDVALERVSVAGDEGWDEAAVRVTRMSGPRWTHDIDDAAARLLAGCLGGLTTDDLVELLEAATGEEGLRDPAHRLLADLHRHGFVTFL